MTNSFPGQAAQAELPPATIDQAPLTCAPGDTLVEPGICEVGQPDVAGLMVDSSTVVLTGVGLAAALFIARRIRRR